MDETVKVIFETLPKESLFIKIYRGVFRKPREGEDVRLTLNGNTKIIKRGVQVELSPSYLEIADSANEYYGSPLKYGYTIV